MADQWYYTQGDQRHGPADINRLKQLAASGALHATDLVWKEGMAEWAYAAAIPGLFPAGTPVPTAPTAPTPRTPKPVPAGMSKGATIAIAAILGAVLILPICCCGGYFLVSSFTSRGEGTK